MTAFQTYEGIFAWDRLTMGTRPASTVQQSAYYRAMDTYLSAKWRHHFALYANDIAAGADTLEELFELLKALIECFDKAGIQVKAINLIFGSDAAQRRKPMSHTQHVHSKERGRAEGIPRLHSTDESVLPLLRHSGFSVAQVGARNGTVPEAMASGNRLRHRVPPNQIDDVG
jgi:hypothetical protein